VEILTYWSSRHKTIIITFVWRKSRNKCNKKAIYYGRDYRAMQPLWRQK